ncbi:hypothetical protein RB195_013698 [Necator americanus]|uniref:PAN domain protein n=1 Tax=Necator americanus TaxID=51031 RepID=A0ABR1DX74_NECAM
MYDRRRLNWIKFALHFAQITSLLTCTFVPVKYEFAALVHYEINLETQERCLMACYQDTACTFVQYESSVCKIFKEGTNTQQPSAATFQIYREQEGSSCYSSLKIGKEVTFKTIQAKPTDTSIICNTGPNAPIIIRMYKYQGIRFYSTDSSGFLPDGSPPDRKLWLTKNPEPQCTAVPVFLQANHRRLFFGNVYNTTGYYFLNGYVYAEYCVSSSGNCCGAYEFREYILDSENYVYRTTDEKTLQPSNFGQTFFMAGFGDHPDWIQP